MPVKAHYAFALLALSAALPLTGFTALACRRQASPPPSLFTDDERKTIVAYWNAPGRYVVAPTPDAPERINITVAGSTWYRPFAAFVASRPEGDPDAASWRQWFMQRMAADKAAVSGLAPAAVPVTSDAVKAAVGEPPPLYEKVHPARYTVTFAPTDAAAPFVYTDNIPFGDRKSYFGAYRSTNGVIKAGHRVRDLTGPERAQLDALFQKVGGSDMQRHVAQAVSALEGGFDSVNTYDTGWVSIGFIQFIFARGGNGSLSAVLARLKADDLAAFQDEFHRFGVDVGPDTVVDVVAPTTGTEVRGSDAVQAIIDDKRLTAVFERAGAMDPFCRAQIVVALQRYWAGDDPITIPVNVLYEQKGGDSKSTALGTFFGPADSVPEIKTALAAVPDKQKSDPAYRAWVEAGKPIAARVSDIVKSEAGMATLMDRKVNRGNIGNFAAVAAVLMNAHHLTRVEDLAAYERPLIEAMQYRANFLKDPALSQPPEIKAP